MFGRRQGRGFPAISRQFLRHDVQAMSRMLRGNILIFTQCPRRIRAAGGMQPDFRIFLGHLQVVIGAYFLAVFGTRCACNFRDASGRRQGCNLVFRSCPGCVMTTTGMEPDFRQCPGRIVAGAGIQPDFQAFLGSFWDTCTGHVRDASWPGQGWSLIFRQFRAVFGPDVPAIFGTPPGQDSVCRSSLGRVMATARMQPDLQCVGNVRDASGLLQGCNLISRHLWVVSGIRCAGHAQDVAGMQPDFQAFQGGFWDMVCRPRPGCIRATAGSQPDFKHF
ncbi:Hypothetical predicted protein [Olea europaea subsp. europaea]|uniref:Uncharacterized protein n=1 Tax=Olea europaea subsp. europaea TaxID=158383 RepID=A0A8S0PMD2_OLEEU|nr:Hypothetical predicted protein [Olea europaea subsp. europaea]